MNLKKSQSDIIKVDLFLNVIFFIVELFTTSSWLVYTFIIGNIVLLTTYLIITRYYLLLVGLSTTNRIVNKMSEKLEGLHGEISRQI